MNPAHSLLQGSMIVLVRPVKHSALFLLLTAVTLTPLRVWSDEQDILTSLKGHELGFLVQDPQSHHPVPAKYGDPHLAKAEQVLSDIPRPWTVPKMIAIFKKDRAEWWRKIAAIPRERAAESTEMQFKWDDRCQALTRVLAASRDARAAVVLGEGSEKWSPEQFYMIDAMFDYFVGDMYYGLPPDAKERKWETGNMLELTYPATKRWWNDNKARLKKEAAALEKDQ
jgi:hypothetical protein